MLSAHAREYLTERLAIYLKNYPGVQVKYDGERIHPQALIRDEAAFNLGSVRPGGPPAELVVVEWAIDPGGKKLLVCDPGGFVCYDAPAGVQARGIYYSGYVRCVEAREWAANGSFLLGELLPEIAQLLDRAKKRLREWVRDRLAREAQELVGQWKAEQIYPYSEDEPDSPLHRAERQVFDIVASRVHQHHPAFREAETESRRLTLELMRQAVESNPTSLRRIFDQVLRLPKDQQDELAELFERVGVDRMMAAAKEVERRLKAITGLEAILFDEDWRERLLERTQLHRILVHQLWVFGDEYTLDADDESLTAVLKAHLKHLHREEIAPVVNVQEISGKEGMPDLMLSRQFARDSDQVEHLVIELKRPSKALGQEEITQIKNYAYAVSVDERFSKEKSKWTFLLIGNEFDQFAERDLRGTKLPPGCLWADGNMSIWMRRWGDVLHEARSRHRFFRDQLDLEVSRAEGYAYLQQHYAALLQGRGLTKKQERALALAAAETPPQAASDGGNAAS